MWARAKRRFSGYSLHFKLVPKLTGIAYTLHDISASARPLIARLQAKAMELRLNGYIRLAVLQPLSHYSAWLEGETSGGCLSQDAFLDWLWLLVEEPAADLVPRVFLRKSEEAFAYTGGGSGGGGGGSRSGFFIDDDHIITCDDS